MSEKQQAPKAGLVMQALTGPGTEAVTKVLNNAAYGVASFGENDSIRCKPGFYKIGSNKVNCLIFENKFAKKVLKIALPTPEKNRQYFSTILKLIQRCAEKNRAAADQLAQIPVTLADAQELGLVSSQKEFYHKMTEFGQYALGIRCNTKGKYNGDQVSENFLSFAEFKNGVFYVSFGEKIRGENRDIFFNFYQIITSGHLSLGYSRQTMLWNLITVKMKEPTQREQIKKNGFFTLSHREICSYTGLHTVLEIKDYNLFDQDVTKRLKPAKDIYNPYVNALENVKGYLKREGLSSQICLKDDAIDSTTGKVKCRKFEDFLTSGLEVYIYSGEILENIKSTKSRKAKTKGNK